MRGLAGKRQVRVHLPADGAVRQELLLQPLRNPRPRPRQVQSLNELVVGQPSKTERNSIMTAHKKTVVERAQEIVGKNSPLADLFLRPTREAREFLASLSRQER